MATCGGVLGAAAPHRTRTAVLDPTRPAIGLDTLTAHIFLTPTLRAVPGTDPPIFEVGNHARRSPSRAPRRRPGVLFPDGRIEPVAEPRDPRGRYMVAPHPRIAEIKVAAVNGHVTVTGVRPVPRFVITGTGAVIVHKDRLPIICSVRWSRRTAPRSGSRRKEIVNGP